MKRDNIWREAPRGLAVVLALATTSACAESESAIDARSGEAQTSPARAVLIEGAPPTAGALAFARGGKRLAAMHDVAEGGAELFEGFEDRELDTACTWVHASDRTSFKCVPADQTDVVYLDEACTEPAMSVMWQMVDRVRRPKLVSDRGAPTEFENSCGTTYPVPRKSYRVGEKVREGGLEDGSKLYTRSAGECHRAAAVGLLPPAAFRLEPLPESMFVSGHIRAVDVGGGLVAQRLEAEDGSQTTLGVTDADRKPCELLPSGPCVPGRIARHRERWMIGVTAESQAVWADVHQDARCEVGAFAHGSHHHCGEPDFGLELRDGLPHVYSLTLATKVFLRSPAAGGSAPASCEPQSVRADSRVFVSGPEVTASFPAARRVRTGSGPLFREQLAAAGENLIPLERGGAFMDAAGRSCTVMPAEDGNLRCFPDRYQVHLAGYWRDPMCKEPLFVSDVEDLSDLIIMAEQTMYRPSTIRALSTLKVYDGTRYASVDGRCEAQPEPIEARLLARDRALAITVLPKVELVAL